MGKIVLLDDLTINQIAAGEVIERPASVIKEMVENSIDAGSKNITIEIKNGGISLIRITDDGSGIAFDDMEIAFERHATSKIRSAKDLETVGTMGFRGEALASIAAISKVEMISKTENEDLGHKIVVEGGKIVQKTEVGAQKGTIISVQDLFYNTPVRYKFLKKDYTEAGYIETVVTRIALINKNVAIKLLNNDKVLLQTNGSGDLKDILYAIYGKDVANGVINIDYQYEDMKVTGVVGKPDIARSNRSNQMFFVNNRYIKDVKLSTAIEQAYRDILPTGKYAFAILNIEMDPRKVDVNVHPAKLEVRFQEETEVFRAVYNAIKAGLGEIAVQNKENIFEKQEKIIDRTVGQVFETKEGRRAAKPENKEKDKDREKSGGFSSFFKKFAKDDKEKEEEVKEDDVKEVDVKEDDVKEVPDQTAQEIKPVEKKEIMLGNTKISSNTRTLDFNINEALKDATMVIDSTKKIEIQETQTIPTTREIAAEETQTIDTNEIKEELKQEEAKQEEEKQEVKNIESEEELKPIEATVPSIEEVENITSRILELKMNNMDNTQMIDTSRVREVMEENEVTPEFANMYKKTFGVDANAIRKEREIEAQEREKINVSKEFVPAQNITIFENEEIAPRRVNYKLIGTAFDTNIIIELNNEMYIIDQNAAFFRLTYETVKALYYDENRKDSQTLLLPDIITVSFREMSLARENVSLFERAGFAFEEFGDKTLKLTTVPAFCEDLNTKQLFLNVLNEMDRVAFNEKEEKEEKFIIAVAKNAAANVRHVLDAKEIDDLLQRLLTLDNPFEIIDNTVTAIKMSRADIEKKFSRRK